MITKDAHIVILNYQIPPNPGVGGRRWVKFAKYFRKAGFYNVTALTVKPNKNDVKSFYQDDIKGVEIEFYGNKVPMYFYNGAKSLLQKVKYKLYLAYRRKAVNGTPFDVAALDEKSVLEKLHQIHHAKPITLLIASGAPFHLLYFASKFKILNNYSFKVLCDLRDPWVSGGNYGIANLNNEKLKAENEKEAYVIKHADIITSPSQEILDDLMIKHNMTSYKFELLPHGYDSELINDRINKRYDGKKKLIYIGTIYSHTEEHLNFIVKLVLAAKGELIIDFYSHIDAKIYELLTPVIELGWVSIKGFLEEKELFNCLVEYDFALLFVRFNYGMNFVSTKYYELAAAKIPIIGIGGEGEALKFIKENKLGLTYSNLNVDLPETIAQILMYTPSAKYDVSSYSYIQLTNKLIHVLNEKTDIENIN